MSRTIADQFKNKKVIVYWILGAFLFLIASLIAGNTRIELGATTSDFIMSLAVSFLLFLLAGFLWIKTAIIIKELEES